MRLRRIALLFGGAPRRWIVGLLVVTLLGLALRLHRATHVESIPDEEISIPMAEKVFRPSEPWPLHGGDHPALGTYLLAGSGWLFGRSLLGYRLLSVLTGTLALVLLARATAWSASRGEGLLAALLLAVNPLHVDLASRAFEMSFEILFVTAAWSELARLPSGARSALVRAAVFLGLAFMCNESAALVGLGFALVIAARRPLRAALRPADYAWAAAAGLLVIAPDVAYNLTAAHPDYHYVNYVDHLVRVARPDAQLQGLGFFLRDAFNAVLASYPRVWVDHRCEYAGPGLVLGGLLLAGFLHSFRRSGDPTGGLWRIPPLLFLLVTSFTQPLGPSELDPPIWTWPVPALPLVTAAAARLVVLHARRLWWLFLLLAALFLMPGPPSRVPCG